MIGVFVVIILFLCFCRSVKVSVISPSPETADMVDFYHSKSLNTSVITGRVLYTKKDSVDQFTVKYPNHQNNGQDFLILDSIVPFGDSYISFCEWDITSKLIGAVMKSDDLVFWERISVLGDQMRTELTNMVSDGKTTIFSYSVNNNVWVNTDGLTSSNITFGAHFIEDCWWWARYDPTSKLFIEFSNSCRKDGRLKGGSSHLHTSKDGFHWEEQKDQTDEINDLRIIDDGTWVISIGSKVFLSTDQGKSMKRIFWHILDSDKDSSFLSTVYSAVCTVKGVCGIVVLTDYILGSYHKAHFYVSTKSFKDFKLVYTGSEGFDEAPRVGIANGDIFFYGYALLTFDYVVWKEGSEKAERVVSKGWQHEIFTLSKDDDDKLFLASSRGSFLKSSSFDGNGMNWVAIPTPSDESGCSGVPANIFVLKNGEKRVYAYYCSGSLSIQTSVDFSGNTFQVFKFPGEIAKLGTSFSLSKLGEDTIGIVFNGYNSSYSYPVFMHSTLLSSGEMSDFEYSNIDTEGGEEYLDVASQNMKDDRIYFMQDNGVWFSNNSGRAWYGVMMTGSYEDSLTKMAIKYGDRIVLLMNFKEFLVYDVNDESSFRLICKSTLPKDLKAATVLKYFEGIDLFVGIANGNVIYSSDGCGWKYDLDGTYLYLNDLSSSFDGKGLLGVGQNGVTIVLVDF